MAKPICMVSGAELENAAEDFRSARKVEQYRISDAALYMPEGLRWKYIPFGAIDSAEESFRVISAGHCVPVREKRPEIDLETEAGPVHLQLEKQENMKMILDAIEAASAGK